jgi:hypothetical protein
MTYTVKKYILEVSNPEMNQESMKLGCRFSTEGTSSLSPSDFS